MNNINKFCGEAHIVLDEPRVLKIDYDALIRAEEACDTSLLGMNPFKSMSTLRAWIFAGLLADFPEVTPKWVAEQLHKAIIEKRYPDVQKAVLESYKNAFLPDVPLPSTDETMPAKLKNG